MSRLIDAEVLKEDLTRFYDGEVTARQLIDEQPTVELEPKKSVWIRMSDRDGEYYCCNNCGEELPRYTKVSPSWNLPFPQKYSIDPTDFCPHCGSDNKENK